jgi:hypothetical protein
MIQERVFGDIAKKRAKQREKGFTAEHDDQHKGGELAEGAGAFIIAAIGQLSKTEARNIPRVAAGWPFKEPFHAGETYEDNLISAAAMLIAELERRYRLEQTIGMPTGIVPVTDGFAGGQQ